MFGPAYFGGTYFGPNYFPPSGLLTGVEPPVDIQIPGTGGGSRSEREGYRRRPGDDLAETRRKKILREDDDIIALIASMITRDIL